MLDKINFAVSGGVPSALLQPLDGGRGAHPSLDRLQETLAQHVEAAIVTSLDPAAIEGLALDILGQAAIQGDPKLALKIGLRVAELLNGSDPIPAKALKQPRDRPPVELLEDVFGKDESQAVLRMLRKHGAQVSGKDGAQVSGKDATQISQKQDAPTVPGGDQPAPESGPGVSNSMDALWKEHVVDQLYGKAKVFFAYNAAYGKPPEGLLMVADAYLKKHPEVPAANFFQPFRDLMNNEISIPATLPDAIGRELIPFHVFRDWVASGVSRIGAASGREVARRFGPSELIHQMMLTEVNNALRCVFSPLALRLRATGQLSLVRLAEWIGLGVEGGQDGASAVQLESTLVRRFLSNEAVIDAVPDPKVLRDPEILRHLADAGVPGQHAAALLSVASRVDWDVLQAEAKWAVERYATENPNPTFSLNWHNGDLPSDDFALKDFRGRLNALHDESQARIEQYLRLARLGPLANVWTVTAQSSGTASPSSGAASPLSDDASPSPDAASPLSDDASPSPDAALPLSGDASTLSGAASPLPDDSSSSSGAASPSSADAASRSGTLHWKPLPFTERVKQWKSIGMSIDQQYWAGRFLISGLDETSARAIVQANAAHPDRLQAWQGCDAAMDLRPWLDGAMKDAVQRWLTDQSVSAEVLALLPGMIRCDLSVDQIDELIRSPNSITRLNTVFGPQAHTPMRIGAGLLTAAALCDRVNDGGISEDELQEEAHEAEDMSRLRRVAAHARDQLRARLHAMEAIRAEVSPDTPAARQCDTWIQAWRCASESLRELLQPPLEDRLRINPRDVEETLSNVFSNLAFSAVGSAEQHAVDRAALRA